MPSDEWGVANRKLSCGQTVPNRAWDMASGGMVSEEWGLANKFQTEPGRGAANKKTKLSLRRGTKALVSGEWAAAKKFQTEPGRGAANKKTNRACDVVLEYWFLESGLWPKSSEQSLGQGKGGVVSEERGGQFDVFPGTALCIKRLRNDKACPRCSLMSWPRLAALSLRNPARASSAGRNPEAARETTKKKYLPAVKTKPRLSLEQSR